MWMPQECRVQLAGIRMRGDTVGEGAYPMIAMGALMPCILMMAVRMSLIDGGARFFFEAPGSAPYGSGFRV